MPSGDVNLAIGAAQDVDRGHAVDLLERGLDDVLGEFRRFAERATAALQRVREHRRRADVDAGNRGLLHFGGELVAGLGDALAHLGGGVLHVDAELEDDNRGRQPLARVRADAVDAVERDDGVLDGLADVLLDLFWRRAGVRDGDGDERERDVGEEIGADARQAHEAEHHQRGDDHHREDGAPDGDAGDAAAALDLARAAGRGAHLPTSTSSPSFVSGSTFTRSWSSAVRPLVTSQVPSSSVACTT